MTDIHAMRAATHGRPTMVLINAIRPDEQAAVPARGQRPRGIAQYIGQLRDVACWFGNIAMERVTINHSSRYPAHLAQPYPVVTGQHAMCVLHAFFQWARAEGMVQHVPTMPQQFPGCPGVLPLGVQHISSMRERDGDGCH